MIIVVISSALLDTSIAIDRPDADIPIDYQSEADALLVAQELTDAYNSANYRGTNDWIYSIRNI
jgi:hypothetical protein